MDRASLGRACVGLALLLSASVASAQAWTGPAATFAHPLGGTVSIEGPFSVWPALPDGNGGATIRGGQKARFPGGQSPTFNLSRAISPAGLKVGARVAARLSGPIGIGLLALDGLRWANDQWEKQEGVPPAPNRYWRSAGACASFAQECSYAEAVQAGLQSVYDSFPPQWGYSFPSYVSAEYLSGNPSSPTSLLTYRITYNVAQVGNNTFNVDGYGTNEDEEVAWVPASDTDIEVAIGNALVSDPSEAPDVLRAALQNGATIEDFSPGSVQVDGPSSVQGPSTTSTHVGPDGTTTTVNNTTYNVSYSDSSVRITESVTTTVTHPDSTVETTTTENEPPAGEGSEAVPEQADPCELNPEASGCAPLGTPEPPQELGEEDRSFSIEPEMSAAGTCPEPIALSFMSWSGELRYDNICALASGIRPLVLVFSWLGAALWVFAVGRAS